jgi:hypothetical protein
MQAKVDEDNRIAKEKEMAEEKKRIAEEEEIAAYEKAVVKESIERKAKEDRHRLAE